MELNIEDLQRICTPENIIITIHAAKRLEQRGIFLKEVMNCIMTGEIIEQYPDDYPYPSCLTLGNTNTNGSVVFMFVRINVYLYYINLMTLTMKQNISLMM